MKDRLRPDAIGVDWGGRYAHRETAAYQQTKRERLAALESLVSRLANTPTVESDQVALLGLVAEARTLVLGGR